MATYAETAQCILMENKYVIEHLDSGEVDRLILELQKSRRVFFFAVGRVFLSLQCFGKRLGHLGIDCQLVGSMNEKPIGPEDLMLIASGSGESKLPVQIAQIAKSKDARLGLITAARASTIKSISDFAVHLPCPTKNDSANGIESIQPMTALFDQSLHLFGDIVTQMIYDRRPDKVDLWKYHANLE